MVKRSKTVSKESWFWTISTKWWFLLAFILSMTVLMLLFTAIVASIGSGVWGYFWMFLLLWPIGFLYLTQIIVYDESIFPLVFLVICHIGWIASSIVIPYFKAKKGVILRKLIIFWIIFIALCFVGCEVLLISEVG